MTCSEFPPSVEPTWSVSEVKDPQSPAKTEWGMRGFQMTGTLSHGNVLSMSLPGDFQDYNSRADPFEKRSTSLYARRTYKAQYLPKLSSQNTEFCHLAQGRGHWGARNTAIPQKNSANTAIPQKNRQIPQHRVETRCNLEINTLYVKLSANNIEITIRVC